MCRLPRKSHLNVKFLNSTGNVMACHVSLSHVNVKFLNSIGNVTACHVSLTKEISCKCQISEWYRKSNNMSIVWQRTNDISNVLGDITDM